MRVVVVETDAQGRSGVGQIIERTGAPTEETSHGIFSGQVVKAAHPNGQDGFVDLSPGAGAAMWRVYDLPPTWFTRCTTPTPLTSTSWWAA